MLLTQFSKAPAMIFVQCGPAYILRTFKGKPILLATVPFEDTLLASLASFQVIYRINWFIRAYVSSIIHINLKITQII
jgi:hypothetical protein